VSAQDLMTRNPVTVSPEATLAEVWDLMRDRGIRHVPVVEAGTLVGMLSDRDLAHVDLPRLLSLEGAEALRRELSVPVVKVMTPDVVAVGPEAEVGEVVDLLVEHRVGAVPVVQPETGELIGIVSYIDVLRAVRDLLDAE
jgi:acetoin utilization protein AcuB